METYSGSFSGAQLRFFKFDAPVVHDVEDRFEFPAERRQRILNPGGNLLMDVAGDDATVFQFAELSGQRPCGDAVEQSR